MTPKEVKGRIVSYAHFIHEASVYNKPNRGEKRYMQFVQFLPLIVRAHHIVWPDWTLRIATDLEVQKFPYFHALMELGRDRLIELVSFGASSSLCGQGGMLERVRPAFNEAKDYVACRDIDSIPLPRDYDAVQEFIESDKALGVVHSASAHSGLMGGLTSINCRKWREKLGTDFGAFLERWGKGIDMNVHGADQVLLNRLPEVFGDDILIHELHHQVGDLRGEVRPHIMRPAGPPTTTRGRDSFSKIIGGCEEPLEPFDYYDSLDLPIIHQIQECEKAAGVDARALLVQIRGMK